jgi:hypothetical protein
MESWSFSPSEGRPGHPYIEFGGQVIVERWVLLTRVIESLWEGEASKLGWQSILSCLGIIARSGMIIVMVLFLTPWHVWHGATVLVMMTV